MDSDMYHRKTHMYISIAVNFQQDRVCYLAGSHGARAD